MATQAPTTPAPTGAPPFRFTLDAVEDIQGDFATLQAVIRQAANTDGKDAAHLLEAAVLVAKHVSGQFETLVAAGYADRGEGR